MTWRCAAEQPERAIAADEPLRRPRRRAADRARRAAATQRPGARVETARQIVLGDAQRAQPAGERRQVERAARAAARRRRRTARSRSWRRWRAPPGRAACAIDAPPCASPALARTSARPCTQMRSLTPVPGSESSIAPGANGLADACRPERSRSARSPRNAPSGPRNAQTTTDTLPGLDAAHEVLGLAEHEAAGEELGHHRRVRRSGPGAARGTSPERRAGTCCRRCSSGSRSRACSPRRP